MTKKERIIEKATDRLLEFADCVLKLECDCGRNDHISISYLFYNDLFPMEYYDAAKRGWRVKIKQGDPVFYCPDCSKKNKIK